MKKEKPIGYINFDGTVGENNEIEIRVPYDKLSLIRRGQYIKLESDNGNYISRIIKGPFFQPDAVSKDSAFARASILHAEQVNFRPDFHGVCIAEVLGELLDEEDFNLVSANNRPFPQTAVIPVRNDEIEKILKLEGDVYLGFLYGYPGVRVHFKHNEKKVLPRNIGIFGTIGSGKTNTSQVLIEELSNTGWSVIVLDIEGEYIEMDEKSKEAQKGYMKQLMKEFNIEPKGIEHLKVYHPLGMEENRDDSKEIGIKFANVDPYMFVEILELNEAQSERFMGVYAEVSAERQTKKSSSSLASSTTKSNDGISEITLDRIIEKVRSRLKSPAHSGDRASYSVVKRKLEKLNRLKIFHDKKHLGDFSCLLEPSLVSIFDLSNSPNLWVNNIFISTLLKKVFEFKINATEKNTKINQPVMIIIEEAHSFVSREKAKVMSETLDILREISRRGRKRWIGICFVTQQPAHLPPEIYELCNTKFVHQTTGEKNLNAIKSSAGSVNKALWNDIPILSQGRCLLISPKFKHPIMVRIRPSISNRRMTE